MKMSNLILSSTAFAIAMTLGGAAVATAQTSGMANGDTAMKSDQPVTDSWITTKVKSELATTDGVKSMDVSVKTVDGVVSLTGVLMTDTAVKKAIAAAQAVKGVKKVDHSGLKSKA
jgi:hyperosmotically inducible protein